MMKTDNAKALKEFAMKHTSHESHNLVDDDYDSEDVFLDLMKVLIALLLGGLLIYGIF